MSWLLSAADNSILRILNLFISFAKSAFLNFGINDAIDIFLLTVFFVFVFKFMKGKKLGSLIIGVFICFVGYLIASVFSLAGVKFILSGIFQIGFLAFIVLFQPEIRDLLEKLGSTSIVRLLNIGDSGKNIDLNYHIIDNVCSAVRELSSTKTGALIVIERTTQLDEVTKTGVSINADVNSYLLRNLFYDKAPLHDGAVVIDEGKIASAGCILPLTRRSDFEGDLGTRHKAAIGLSEISDAIIIVVSEETGIISVAMDYTLTRDYTADTLRKFLLKNILQDADIEI